MMPAAARCEASRSAVGRSRKSSAKDSTASAAASASGSHSAVAPKARLAAAPARSARPPVRGTGRSCSERSFGWSSAMRANWASSRRSAANVTAKEMSVSAPSIGAILAGAVPRRRGVQALLARKRRAPAQPLAHRTIVYRKRAGELAGKQRRRKAQEPCRPPERLAELAAKLRRRNRVAVRDQIGTLSTEATQDGIDEVADVEQAAPVVDRRERQRPAAGDRAHQRQEVRLDAGAVNQRRPQHRETQAADRVQRFLRPR